ncbi:sterol 3-beta-glucosyltransferase UGT80A2 isoform X2 [Arachis hypogaea]|uniref:sterol 3-beta-glucosyltransferase UGT80A2 isoform X2 n=1 Tax=Arachis hypogaea TaxID=3818 RepID=UPI000DED28B0|nr:sterol 3-beta-glucosyltransferase UGT80A2 isoform X3 [Arachis hypogaea]
MERTKPKAVFMAFGTKGDVYPLSAIAAAFACDQKQYEVILITHSAHQSLSSHLAEKHVEYCPVSSPPVLSAEQNNDLEGKEDLSFSLQKKKITRDHRQECYSLIERIFGDGSALDGDVIVINFFALEGWSLAESFCVRCVVAAPYVVPYSAPATFESQFQRELPLLYRYLTESPSGKVCWQDVIHWMWPLFTENWGLWRNENLHLSSCPFTDPVTGIPTWHQRPQSPLVMYGFSKEVVECPAYWPPKVRVCGFWFPPIEWQFTCKRCQEVSVYFSSGGQYAKDDLCPSHLELHNFIKTNPVFVGLSSVGSMGFLKDPHAFLSVLQTVLNTTSSLPYSWLFKNCAAVIHHGGSGTTAAALQAGTPQVVCPFMLDQFYWAERMHWLGVSPEPLSRNHLVPDKNDETSVQEAAHVLSKAIHDALSSRVKGRAAEISERISLEDGVSEAVKCLKEELGIN